VGLNCVWLNGGDSIELSSRWDNGGGSSARISGLSALPVQFIYVRYQRDPSMMTEALEAWDINGNRVGVVQPTFPSANSYSSAGALVGGDGVGQSVAFFRIHTTMVPVNSRPPVTADNSNTLVHWTFDGTLADSSGNGYNATMTGGSASYVTTPGQNLAVAFPKTYNAPSWTNWASLRAGYPNQLDGTASYSEADATPGVTYYWSQISGPTILRWSDRTQAQPLVTGAIFGTYVLRLTVTDAGGNTSSSDLSVGAVAMDNNGVVVNADPRADQIFGPMIAFGKNPWGYADQQAKNSVDLRLAAYSAQGLNPPPWATLGAGTVSYTFTSGVPACTTLTANITASATSIPIAQASCLNLSQLPTTIMLGGQELVRISATTATTGPATLTVAYNGRGLPTFCNNSACPGIAGPVQQIQQAWNSGTSVGQSLTVGSGTSFGTDPNVPLCPAGLPGPAGPIVNSTGSVTLARSSATITGSGTSFSPAMVNDFIRISATHAGGTVFVYWGAITAVADATHITVGQPLPLDVDTTAFSYSIIQPTYASLDFIAPDGSTQRAWHYLQYCESQTQAAIIGYYETRIGGSAAQTAMHWSRYDQQYFGAASAYGPNFYGEDLGHLAFYLRSGYSSAQTAATVMSRYWVKGPEIGGGWLQGIPLVKGGGALGAMANLILNPQVKQSCPAVGCLDWPDVRGFPGYFAGDFGSYNCDFADSRDSGYMAGWLAIAANYDSSNSQRTIWKNSLRDVLNRENNCKRADNSWSNSAIFGNAGGVNVTLTNGSTAATGAGFYSGNCYGIASGTVTVTTGSSAFTGTGLVSGAKMIVTASGKDYVSAFVQTGGASGNFSFLWPGPSGTFQYVIESSTWQTAIGSSTSDYSNLSTNYACTYNSPTSLTLNKPWAGTSGVYSLRSYTLMGLGQQPYMMGIKLRYLKWASYSDDAGIAAQARTLIPLAGQWVHDVGYDPNTQGMNYGRVFDWCEPATTTAPGQQQSYRQGECNYGGDPNFIKGARALTAETSSALWAYYDLSGGSPSAVAWGDTAYGSLWGDCTKTTGAYCDAMFDNLDTANSNLAAYKWTGFFFGMGMAHQWPAVRVGGVAAPRNRTVSIGLNLSVGPKAQVIVTAPSGAVTAYPCATATCNVTVDDRQGAHWYQVQYLSSAGAVVAQTDPDLLAAQ
ncbi:MAG: hypothetical protein JO307_25025, partial [Bryobacterales bacterium]|nr:hypothetical protein [Bryobacterales bacterium]